MAGYSFHMFDALGILLPIILVILAFSRGLLTEIALFLGYGASVALAKILFPHTHPFVAEYVNNAMAADVISIAIVVVPVVLFVRYGVEGILPDVVHSSLGYLNRGLGAALGLVRGVMLALLFVGLVSWAFVRTASVAIYTHQTVSASTMAANLPIRDILCDKAQAKDWSLIHQLEQRKASLSALANEIVAFNKKPQDFPVVEFSRTLSASLCGEASRSL